MEPAAIAEYARQQNVNVLESGLVVSADQSWLAATPDGLVIDEAGQIIVVEVKCPISCRESNIKVDYVKEEKLKKTHPYFFQVQVQMYLCKATKCHFFVFSPVDSLLIVIEFDRDFL
jgi:hypothetical protein